MTNKVEGKTGEVSLPSAAHRLRKTWTQAYDLVLRGLLKARHDGRRWRVDEADLERLEREKQGSP